MSSGTIENLATNAMVRAFGGRVIVPKTVLPELPAEYQPSPLSLRLGAQAVFRQNVPRGSIQARDFGAYWVLERDEFNPEWGVVEFIGHAIVDAPHVTLAVLLVAFAIARKER